MSLLKRVEEAYLGVLRFIIIVAATLLLLSSIVFAVLAANNWRDHKPAAADGGVTVSPEDVTKEVLAHRAKPAADTKQEPSGRDQTLPESRPNLAEFDRAASAIVAFVGKHGQGVQTLDKERVMPVLYKRADPYANSDDAKPFAEGLALAMEKSLGDPKVVALIEPVGARQAVAAASSPEEGNEEPQQAPQGRGFKVSPIDVLNNTLEVYVSSFEKRVKERDEAKSQAAVEAVRRQETAMTQLYMAGGIFGAFLFLVFISIVVKIERNLRVLTLTPNSQPKLGRDSAEG